MKWNAFDIDAMPRRLRTWLEGLNFERGTTMKLLVYMTSAVSVEVFLDLKTKRSYL